MEGKDMTRQELELKKRALAKKVKRLELFRKVLLGGTLLILGFLFMDLCLTAWDKEIQLHGEYNKQYIERMKEGRE